MSTAVARQLRFSPLAESALLVTVEHELDVTVIETVGALAAALKAATMPGIVDIVPAYTTLLISFDPTRTTHDGLIDVINQLTANLQATAARPSRRITVPVIYGGEYGPDLADVAAHTGLTVDDVVAAHTAPEYLVACIGFGPGFGYLWGLPPTLTTPRLAEPRRRVPAGSVGIGGQQTGIYPLTMPGGWRLIGRTPLRLFDPERETPSLLSAGDRVRFTPIDAATFAQIAAAVTHGSYQPVVEPADAR